MFQIHTEVTDKLISDVTANVKGKRFSRALWLDIEPAGIAYTLVLRGLDKVTADAKDSTAKEGEDRKLHDAAIAKAAEDGIFWTTADFIAANVRDGGYYAPRQFILATFDDESEADQVCAELLAFYSDAVSSDDSPALPFSERVGGLTAPAREILPILLAVFGSSPNSEMLQRNRLGSFADYLAGRARKVKETKTRQSIEQIKADAQAELMQRITAQLANQPGSNQAQLMAIIAQLQMPVSAK